MSARPTCLLLLLAGCGPAPADEIPIDGDPTIDDTGSSTTTDSGSRGGTDDTGPTETGTRDTGGPTDPGPLTAARCFADVWDGAAAVDYDQFGPTMGAHCLGTDHQEIVGVERVVFVGDSITVGTPPAGADDWYRNVLAEAFVERWALEAPSWDWQRVDATEGVAYEQESGDFAVCAKWGARTDDLLLEPHLQLETCLPEADREAVTLVVMTVGGNDVYSLLEDIQAGHDEATLRATFGEATALLREAVEWIVEPGRFPNGVYVVFANLYDFTDAAAAADMAECPGAQALGLDEPLNEPIFWDIMADAQEEYVSIAVDTRTDLFFLGEAFCGHGYAYDDASGRCWRDEDAELWLDFTCEHPSDEGHAAIAEMVLAVVDE